MKNPKRLTLEQKKAVSAAGLNAENWMLIEHSKFYLKIINKASGRTRRVDRYAIPKKEGKKNEVRDLQKKQER